MGLRGGKKEEAASSRAASRIAAAGWPLPVPVGCSLLPGVTLTAQPPRILAPSPAGQEPSLPESAGPPDLVSLSSPQSRPVDLQVRLLCASRPCPAGVTD